MKSKLSISSYNASENSAKVGLSVPLIMAFRPVTYEQVGFPTIITGEKELIRYVDHNFEGEVPHLYDNNRVFPPIGYINQFTTDESKLLNNIRDIVAQMSKREFDRAIKPITNLMVQMGPYRAFEHLSSSLENKKLSVFEVGPGLSYLGALLANNGHRYLSYDVTQSIYLWQSWLMSEVAGDDFIDIAGEDASKEDISTKRVVHMPWWEYVKMLYGTDQRVDVVYSNSNLGEMSPLALKHVLQVSRHLLQDSDIGLFMYYSTGMLAQSSAESLAAEFSQFGYHKVFDSPFIAYTLNRDNIDKIRKIYINGVPSIDKTNDGKILTANQVMNLKKEEAPIDVDLTSWVHGWFPPFED